MLSAEEVRTLKASIAPAMGGFLYQIVEQYSERLLYCAMSILKAKHSP